MLNNTPQSRTCLNIFFSVIFIFISILLLFNFYKKVVAVPQVFDLGADGKGMKYVACMSEDSMAHKAASTTRYICINTMYIHYSNVQQFSHTTVSGKLQTELSEEI